MATILFCLAIFAAVLAKLMLRHGVRFFGARSAETVFRSAVAGRYWQLATVVVLVLLVFVAMNPESFPFFIAVDSIGFDLLVALSVLQLRSVSAVGWLLARRLLAGVGHFIWAYGFAPRRKLQLSTAMAAVSYIGAHMTAQIAGK